MRYHETGSLDDLEGGQSEDSITVDASPLPKKKASKRKRSSVKTRHLSDADSSSEGIIILLILTKFIIFSQVNKHINIYIYCFLLKIGETITSGNSSAGSSPTKKKRGRKHTSSTLSYAKEKGISPK